MASSGRLITGGALVPPITLTNTAPATVPFTIVGAASQSADLFDITANGGAAGGLFKIGSAGAAVFGSTVQVGGTGNVQTVGINAVPSAATDLSIGDFVTNAHNSAAQVNGCLLRTQNNGLGDVVGLVCQPKSGATGTVTNLYSIFNNPQLGIGGVTVTNSYDYYAASPTIGAGGAITTQYGLYIAQQKVASVTTGYGIWQNNSTDTNAFAGAIDQTTAAALQIGPTTATSVALGSATALVNFNYATTALGGGAAPTFGTIGGSGPATAAQNSWLKVSIAGTASFIPVWR